MKDSKNWGAVQAGSSWKGKTALQGDTYVSSTGATIRYTTKFRVYETDEQAAEDFCRVILRYDHAGHAARGDVLPFSRALRGHRSRANGGQDATDKPGYYEGHGATPDIRERNHAASVYTGIILANEPGESLVQGYPTPETIREGENSPWWGLVRSLLLLPQGSTFHPRLEQFQEERGLKVDGVVGANTWGKLFAFCGLDGIRGEQ
jgi:hypothetical protein